VKDEGVGAQVGNVLGNVEFMPLTIDDLINGGGNDYAKQRRKERSL
jgi:hypothetical protein